VEVSAEGTELLVSASSELEGVVVPLQPVSAQAANAAAAKQQKNRFNIFLLLLDGVSIFLSNANSKPSLSTSLSAFYGVGVESELDILQTGKFFH
jgi:hypothetical protein